ncbi:MAG: metal-dependent hydrolase, partial [Deltaproteobacteria bacterium]|nr:metal-dependent hydrolase [Deltaproteobacteria bacterium]
TRPKSHIPIVPRRPKWDFADLKQRFFFGGNGLKSAFVVALSGSFPPGEKEFIQSVRLFLDQVRDPELIEDVKDFTAQEGQHSLQHKLLNEAFDRIGYLATRVSEQFEEIEQEWIEKRSDADRLAATVVMEHITAVMAHFALTRPEEFDPLPDSVRELLLWHAIEEIEHKSVAFDVYEECVGDRNRLRRQLLLHMILFPLGIRDFQRMLLRELGHAPTWKERGEMARYLLGPRGLVVSVLPRYLALLKPGFHPWDMDDSHLVEEWKDRLQTALN